MQVLDADVTANDAADRALMKKSGLFGPRALVIFDKNGQDVAKARVTG